LRKATFLSWICTKAILESVPDVLSFQLDDDDGIFERQNAEDIAKGDLCKESPFSARLFRRFGWLSLTSWPKYIVTSETPTTDQRHVDFSHTFWSLLR
jgi:hypothetical protein